MSAILNIVGPVVAHRTVARNFKFLSMLTVKQFMMAATQLEDMQLGYLVDVSGQGRASHVFIKKSPDEAQLVLETDPELCAPDRYRSQYNKPISKSISISQRQKLLKMGLVPEKYLK